ncbi:MAG: PP2C family protein-serine/threonine phosphatase, partial [Acidobacteriota bacterium]
LPGVDFAQPAQVLAGLNAVFQMPRQNDLYFTIFYGVYDMQARVVRFASAGHPPPLLFQANGAVRELRCQSIFIGALPEARFRQDEIALDGPASLLVFSDGAYELRRADGVIEGYEDFRERCASYGPSGPELADLLNQARAVRGQQVLDDDLSALRLRI